MFSHLFMMRPTSEAATGGRLPQRPTFLPTSGGQVEADINMRPPTTSHCTVVLWCVGTDINNGTGIYSNGHYALLDKVLNMCLLDI